MRLLKRVSIHRKLTLIGLATSACSLMLACAALFTYEVSSFKKAMVQRLTTQAEIAAFNAGSAVLFGDRTAAILTLAALRSEPHMISATIFDAAGSIFVDDRRVGDSSEAIGLDDSGDARSYSFYENELRLSEPILVDGKKVGTLWLRSDTGELEERAANLAFIAGLVLLATLFIAHVVYSKLQRSISKPLLQLAEQARAVTIDKDFSVRTHSESEDEIGDLVSSFNDMLSEIERREAELERQTRELQEEVAARVEAQRELAAHADELVRSNRELENFAYVASHDLQEPLRMVASYTQLLAEEYRGKLGEEADEYIGFAVGGATRMQALIQALLAYSRISTVDDRKTTVDADEILATVIGDLSAVIAESGARVVTHPLPSVVTDPSRLAQVLQNLISNAIKYRRGAPVIEVDARQDEDQWVFSVKDNGIGIESRYSDRVFLMFQRLHTQSEYEGTGIGLALCKRIVERQDGKIWLESEPGSGSTFFFTIPTAALDRESMPATYPPSEGNHAHV